MTTRPHVPVPEEVNVSVVVRVRPPLQRERQLGYSKCVSVDPLCHSLTIFQTPAPSISTSIPLKPLSPPQPTQRTFTFDYVADEFVNQEEMFTSVGKPMAHACLQGYHCCLIAYGFGLYLKGLNGSASQKQRQRDFSPPISPLQSQKIAKLQNSSMLSSEGKISSRNVHFRGSNDDRMLMIADSKHPLETSLDDDSEKYEGRLDPRHQQEDHPSALKSQIAHLKNMNKSLKLDLESLSKEKKSMFSEFADVQRERDQSKKRLVSLEDQVSQLQETIQKLRQGSDKEMQISDDEENSALVNFQKTKHIQAFKRFISRPRVVAVRQKKPNLLCRLLKRKKRASLELVEES